MITSVVHNDQMCMFKFNETDIGRKLNSEYFNKRKVIHIIINYGTWLI